MDQQTGIRLWRIGNVLSCVGVVQFVCCTALAMQCYEGGTMADRAAPAYSFFDNFLSDLGRVAAWSGKENVTSFLLFNGSVVLLGISLFPFFWFLPLHAPDKSLLLRLAAIPGFASVFALIGIGLTPYDVAVDWHNKALAWWLILTLAAVSLHFLALFFSTETPRAYAWLSLGLATMIVGYVFALSTALSGLDPRAESIRQAAAAQKYLVIYILLWFVIFSWRTARSDALRIESRTSEVNEAAQEYLDRVTGGAQDRQERKQ